MVKAVFRKVDHRFVLELPQDQAEHLGLVDGQQVEVQVSPLEEGGISDDELRQIVARLVETHREALDYLAK